MALTNCKECGHQISKSATSCPNCGAKIKRTSLLTKIVAGFFGFVILFSILMAVIAQWSVDRQRQQQAARQAAQKTAEEKRLAALTPEQHAEEEKKRAEQERLRREAEQRRLGLKWNYQETDEKMGRGKIKIAFVKSLNQFEFDFPYRRLQRATLQLRIHPKYGKDVILIIERGQFLCRIRRCTVTVRFGEAKPQTFSASEPADHSTTVLFLRNYGRFVVNAKKVNKVYIEAQFYQEGTRVFEFDVSGLKWP